MQALVLAGGEGTRLRPLTRTVPKPVMPLAGRPFLTFMLDWLRSHGVTEVILSCGFLSDGVHDVLGDIDEGLLEERLVVLNGDVLTDMDLTAELARHDEAGALATLALIAVEDTSSYGVVPTDDAGWVLDFLEKSDGPAPTNRINAGAYVLERPVVEGIPAGRPVSFEREVFPELVGKGLLGWPAEGYWLDIGTPDRYLEATYDLLAGHPRSNLPPRDETGSLIGEGCLTAGAHIGPQTVLGSHCSVGSDSAVERSVLHDGVVVGADCVIQESVLAERVRVGEGAHVEPGAVVGAGARVEPGARVSAEARVEPGERVV